MKLDVFEKNLALRGGLYSGLGIFALALCLALGDADDVGWVESHWSLTLSFLLLVADGAAYIVGHCRNEGGSEGRVPPAISQDTPVATVRTTRRP